MTPYASLLSDPDPWVDGAPGLRDALAEWSTLPRDADRLVGSLHRPGSHHIRGGIRTSARLSAVNGRWLARLPGAVGRRGWRDTLVDYLVDAASHSGAGGRALLGLVEGLRPGVVGEATSVAAVPLSIGQVEHRLPAATSSRLAEIDDAPTAHSEYDQVHRGQLDDGRAVAVVVSRPGTARELRESASLLAPWLVAIELVDRSPWQHGLVEVLRDLTATGQRRCDQRAVALDASVLHSSIGASGVTDVVVARPIPGLVDRDSAVYELPTDLEITGPAPAQQVLAAGMTAIIEAGLVHGAYASHMDRRYVWGGGSVGCLVAGVTLAPLSTRSRRAIASLLDGTADPVDALVSLGTTPSFVDRDSVQRLLASGALTDPLALLRPDAGTHALSALRTLVTLHGVRPTPELAGFGLAVARLLATLRTADDRPDPTVLALRALPRLAGIGARMLDSAA